jgi:hypothetical protein
MKTHAHLWYLTGFLEWEIFYSKVVEKIKTHFIFSTNFPENRAVYEAMWKNMEQPDTPQMTL